MEWWVGEKGEVNRKTCTKNDSCNHWSPDLMFPGILQGAEEVLIQSRGCRSFSILRPNHPHPAELHERVPHSPFHHYILISKKKRGREGGASKGKGWTRTLISGYNPVTQTQCVSVVLTLLTAGQDPSALNELQIECNFFITNNNISSTIWRGSMYMTVCTWLSYASHLL